ncbi:hypothetical protein JOD54_000557 [Actinokineospora baliensis]|uniref:hypothetical protein n=1 Tax=Actinokineospora baliensis TaxID=547056 RepID=UPI00195BD713|nr:hypothetical protein [Actinokineospora baliensis]MBM7770353.1 hypothetical protein [Actinokineospora baliensis]
MDGVVLKRSWPLTAYWGGIAAAWLLLAAIEFDVWGFRWDTGSVWALALVPPCLGLAIWCCTLVAEVGPVRIRHGRLRFWARSRPWSLPPADIQSWTWTADRQTTLGSRLKMRHLTLTLTTDRVVAQRHHLVHHRRPAGQHATQALTAFLEDSGG